ncbi:hypothetical protein C2G38_2127485 [Gigaspora rosea]|uniref:Uncharacterized protein n=1 Tax=Gigaspora rosea TaxID=44941 RepID=A0A397TTM7_9GLOM|nr:hypothetical protein C2G38_2127485 [Gigaspora rosea]
MIVLHSQRTALFPPEVMTASLPRAVPVGVIQPKDGFAPSQGDNGFVPLYDTKMSNC